jgi:hypothetical protein
MEVVQCYIFNGFSSRLSIISFSDQQSSCSIACKFLKSAANGLEAVKCETVLYQQHDMLQGTCAFIQSSLQCTTTLKCVNLTVTSRFILFRVQQSGLMVDTQDTSPGHLPEGSMCLQPKLYQFAAWWMDNLHPARFEPGTFCVGGACDNHYTTQLVDSTMYSKAVRSTTWRRHSSSP